MAFVNVSLLAGMALIGVPIALHLIMRQRPKHILFPPIQFIRKREESNRRTLRLRQWLLLLLRCLAILLAAATLARPSVHSATFGDWLVIAALGGLVLLVGLLLAVSIVGRRGRLLIAALGCLELVAATVMLTMLIATVGRSDRWKIGDREAPVAAVMVLDSAPRMLYRHENQTRLEQARDTADWLVRQLPPDSKVAVLDSRGITPIFAIDMAAARKMIERVAPTGAPRPLSELLESALRLVSESALPRKEIYVLSDLSAASWQSAQPERLAGQLAEAVDTALYVVDVGVEKPQNCGLTDLELTAEVFPENSPLTVRTAVTCQGNGGRRLVELEIENLDPTLPVIRDGKVVLPPVQLRGRREVELPNDGAQTIEFQVADLEAGTRHGRVRITGSDALAIDDVRYVTIQVRPPWLILVVADRDVNTSALVEAIAPYELRAAQRASFDCLVVRPDELASRRLEDFAAVTLLDPPPLPDTAWQQLDQYVRGGGRLAVCLGSHAENTQTFNVPGAVALLPGRLGRVYRVRGRDIYLAPHSYDHPILQPFREVASSVPWNEFPVFRHWSLRDLAPDAHVILRYGNGQPALLERAVGRGLVLTMTTPITELPQLRERQSWNLLAGPDDWPRFVLVNALMRYLVQAGWDRLNYETGQPVVLSSDIAADRARYLLFQPDGETEPIQSRDGTLSIASVEQAGTYRLKGEGQGPVTAGFSVNLPAAAGDLRRADPAALDALLGKDRYQLARDRDQIVREQGQQRAGREFYPLLLLGLAVVLVLEHLLANRFYRSESTVARP